MVVTLQSPRRHPQCHWDGRIRTPHVPGLLRTPGAPLRADAQPAFCVHGPALPGGPQRGRIRLARCESGNRSSGDPGTGKTTLVQAALASERCRNVRVAHIKNPALTRGEFFEVLTDRFGLSRQAATSKTRLLEELEPVLRGQREEGLV